MKPPPSGRVVGLHEAAHAALDMAIANYPSERFTLRNGALVIREYKPAQDRGG
jgi:hypothetical protein